MNQQELEHRLTTANEADLLSELKTLITNTVRSVMKEPVNDLRPYFLSEVKKITDNLTYQVDEAIASSNLEGYARIAIRKALVSPDLGPAFADAIRTLIKAKLLDPRIWLPNRRLPWWRRLLHRLHLDGK